jgi:hypothetical protein
MTAARRNNDAPAHETPAAFRTCDSACGAWLHTYQALCRCDTNPRHGFVKSPRDAWSRSIGALQYEPGKILRMDNIAQNWFYSSSGAQAKRFM